MMTVYNLLLIVFLLNSYCTPIFAQICKNEMKCKNERAFGMRGADCYNKGMRSFPKCVSSDIEVMFLNLNRIRKLNRKDLERYKNLKMLYLSDNVIVAIDDDTFLDQTDLTTLDLSINAISKIPPDIFHLPSLKNFYIGQNLNMNIADVVERAKPITSPLVQIDINNIMSEGAEHLPDFHILPYLVKYNISGSRVLQLSTRQFAGMCQLTLLDSSNVSAEFEKPCDCWTLNLWLRKRNVRFTEFNCVVKETECSYELNKEDEETFKECEEKVLLLLKQARLIKILVPIAVAVALILLILVWWFIRKRKRSTKKIKQPLDSGDATLIKN